jgi:hypothetical protein
MTVMIGVDPHKRSHTAVAIDGDDVELAAIEVRASVRQVDELLGWAERFDARIWAVEGAGGVGYLLAQQLVAAGERVLDVPATLAARVRVLGSGRSNKTDANDGYSIAVAARHAPKLQGVARADHASVLRLLAKRNKELGSARTRTACRLHALLVELVPGGIPSKSRPIAPRRCWRASHRLARWKRRATRWPSNISRTCAASTSYALAVVLRRRARPSVTIPTPSAASPAKSERPFEPVNGIGPFFVVVVVGWD